MALLKTEMAAGLVLTASLGLGNSLDHSIPTLTHYTTQEILTKIIFPLLDSFPEIAWFADDKVAVTQEASGQAQKPGWTDQLVSTTPPRIIKGKGKFIELERMLSSIVFFNFFLCKECDGVKEESERQKILKKAYQTFISVQKEAEKLTFKSFLELHTLARKVAHNKEAYEAMITMLVMSDLGKTPEGKKKALEANLVKLDHDDFVEELLSFPAQEGERKEKLDKITQVFPSFKKTQESAQLFLQKAASAMKIHLGHVHHLEGGQQMFAKFESAVKKGIVTSDILDFAFLIQLSDVAASAAQIDSSGSLALTENSYQGYRLVGEALKIIQQGGNARDALKYYLKARGDLLGFATETPIQRVLVRLACMMRFFSKEEGTLLNQAVQKLSEEQQKLLIEQFGIEDKEIGMNAWKRNPTYVPAVLVNLLQSQKSDESKQVKITRALEGAVCIAAILQKYAESPEHRNSTHPLNFNAYAGIAGRNPTYLSIQHFNPAYISFEGGNVTLDLKAQAEYSSKIPEVTANAKVDTLMQFNAQKNQPNAADLGSDIGKSATIAASIPKGK